MTRKGYGVLLPKMCIFLKLTPIWSNVHDVANLASGNLWMELQHLFRKSDEITLFSTFQVKRKRNDHTRRRIICDTPDSQWAYYFLFYLVHESILIEWETGDFGGLGLLLVLWEGGQGKRAWPLSHLARDTFWSRKLSAASTSKGGGNHHVNRLENRLARTLTGGK